MKKIVLYMTFALILAGRSALAARNAVVEVDEAEIREGPGKRFNVVERIPRKGRVVVSNIPTEGFYKVRTGNGTVGWVSVDSVQVKPSVQKTSE